MRLGSANGVIGEPVQLHLLGAEEVAAVEYDRNVEHRFETEAQNGRVIVERRATPDGSRDSGQPSRRVLQIHQNTDLHWGGMIAFGPDGLLYLAMNSPGRIARLAPGLPVAAK